MPEAKDAEARLDDLRRRLYREDATHHDLDRYLEERASALPPEQRTPPPGPRTAPRRLIALTLGAVVVLAAGAAIAASAGAPKGTPPTSLTSKASTTSTTSTTTVQVDVGDGRVVSIDGSSEGSVPVAASIDGTAVVGQRFEGYGNAVVTVDPPAGTGSGGRAMIAVSSTEPTVVDWRALLLVPRTDGTSFPVALAAGAAEDRSGAHAPTTFVYANRPPTRVAVEAPTGTGWTLVVAFTGRVAPDLR